MRALRTIPVLTDFARDMEEVCPDAWFLNYTNPMSMLTGYMLRYTGVKTVGLCHSVQVCSENLLKSLGMDDCIEGRREKLPVSTIWHGFWSCATATATTFIPRSSAAQRRKTPRKNTAIWCALITSTSSAITAPNRASTTRSTIRSTSRPAILS